MLARLLLLFIGIPIIELCLFMMLGSKIGIAPTLAIIVITGALGAYLTKSQGLKALTNYREATSQGKIPHEAILDGLMILVAGAVLLTPGFLTDAIGFSLLVPSIRAMVRGVLAAYLKGKVTIVGQTVGAPETAGSGNGAAGRPANPQGVIDAEVEVIDNTPGSTGSSTGQAP